MKLQVELELYDVHGGDGETRMVVEKETKLKRTKRRTESRLDIGINVSDDEREETKEEEMEQDINTFRMNDAGSPIMRLGGTHGKIYGAFKESAQTLKMLGEAPFTSQYKRVLNSIIITPSWVELQTNGDSMHVQQLPQILSGMGNRMIVQRFDVIPKCRVKFNLNFPDAIETAVKKLIHGLENISMLNKRRTTCKVMEIKPC